MINNLSVQMIENRYAKNLVSGCLDFSVLENILKNPLSKKKEDCPLWFFCSLIDGNNHKRTLDNMGFIDALILDFDDDLSIRDFKDRFSKYFYYLYTTTNHSKDLDKFRVIMPLKNSVRYFDIREKFMLESLCNFFEGVDVSSFRNFHNLPNLPKDPSDYYYHKNNSEIFFDVDILREDAKKLRRKHELATAANNTKNISKNYSEEMTEGAREKYKIKAEDAFSEQIRDIPSYKTGNRYNQLLSFVGKMINAKYPDGEFIFEQHEIESIVFQNCCDKNVKKMIEVFYSKRSY